MYNIFLLFPLAWESMGKHGKAWKSMESMGTSLCLQIGYIQKILITYCHSAIKQL